MKWVFKYLWVLGLLSVVSCGGSKSEAEESYKNSQFAENQRISIHESV